MEAGDVIKARGAGGVVWELTVPKDGSNQRKLLGDQIASGALVVVDEAEDSAITSGGIELGVPAAPKATKAPSAPRRRKPAEDPADAPAEV